MEQIPSKFFPGTQVESGRRFDRFGLPTLVDYFINSAYSKTPSNWGGKDDGVKRIKQKGIDFLSCLETDLPTIKQRRAIIARLIADRPFVNFLLSTPPPVTPDDRRETRVTDYSRTATSVSKYLEKLEKFLGNYSEYKPLKNHFTLLMGKNRWTKQMGMLNNNLNAYTSFSTNIVLAITTSYEKTEKFDNKRYYKIDSDEYTTTLKGHGRSFDVANRVTGDFAIFKERLKKKPVLTVTSPDFRQTIGIFKDYHLERLLRKAVEDLGKKEFWNIEPNVPVEFNMVLKGSFSASSGLSAKVTCFGKSKTYKLKCIHYEGRNQDMWVHEKEKVTLSKNSHINTEYKNELQNCAENSIFSTSWRFVSSYSRETTSLFEKFNELLFLAAACNFYLVNKGKWVFPKVLPKTAMVTKIIAGKNPLFLKNKGGCVANDVLFSKNQTGLLITGANTGGKTGYANMIALNQVLAQAGFPVFAEHAEIAIKDNILCHYIEGGDIGVNQSRYQSELHRLHEVVSAVTQYSLSLFDEPFTGTSVESGSDQAYHVLKVLGKVKCSFVMNTHYHKLIDVVSKGETETIKNYHFALPIAGKRKTNYKIQQGGIHLSHGDAIALIEKVDYKSMCNLLKERGVL